MRIRFTIAVLLVLSFMVVSGCDDNPAPKQEATLIVTDPNGVAVVLHPNDRTKVFAVASWCPHTLSFVRAISDPQATEDLKPYKLVFVLESDEWPTVRANVKELEVDGKINGLSLDQAMAKLKKNAGNGPVFDPEFLDKLPGPYYFMTMTKGVAFPDIYSVEAGKFDKHAMTWVDTVSPRAEILYETFEKESNND